MIVLMSSVFANVRHKPVFGETLPDVCLHYLGKASFILQFRNGISVVTDYDLSGTSDSETPLYAFKDVLLDIATCSRWNLDSSRAECRPDVVHVLTQASFQGSENLCINGLKITPVLTSKRTAQDNVSFVFAYRNLTIIHLGDVLKDLAHIHEHATQLYFKRVFPKFIDLLLLPIGRSNEFFETLTAFIDLLRPRRVIPMQYQSPRTKEAFLEFLAQQNATGGTQYQFEQVRSAQYTLASGITVSSPIMIISLDPQPFSRDTNR